MKAALVTGVLSVVATLLVGAGSAGAQTFTWVPTTGGLFDSPGNWTPVGGPPGAGDITIFNSTTTQTVIFQSNVTLANHQIQNGNVTFQLNQTTNTMSAANGLIVGNVAGQTGRVTILNGKLSGDASIGDVDASTGFLTIGADAIFDGGSNTIVIGNNGIGTMTINNGGRYTGTN